MAKYVRHVSVKSTPQSQPVFNRKQVQNSAGGYVFELDKFARLKRFLILGCDGGTYYATEKELTIENAKCVLECMDADPKRTIDMIVDVSTNNKAPKNDPAVFALALASTHKHCDLAFDALGKVCRIGTHLFQYVEAVNSLRGWGRGLRRAVGRWYNERSVSSLATQLAKYQQRNGWSHRDVIRLAHVKPKNDEFNRPISWAVTGEGCSEYMIGAFEEAKRATNAQTIADLIRESNLPRECVPTQWLNSPVVWEALLENMPATAMIRNLGKMTSVGLIAPLSKAARLVQSKLGDPQYLKDGRIHPFAVLLALKQYSVGHGDRGSLSWTPNNQVIDALNAAFYHSFGTLPTSDKGTLVALDVSGSMGSSYIAGSSLSAREASSAMAMAVARTCPNHVFCAFSGNFVPLNITSSMRLDTICNETARLPFDQTDCSVPMLWAQKNRINVDTFVIYTDNETWAGNIHPFQALKQYRQSSGNNSKLVVCGMTSTGFSIADPTDPGMLDVVGMDATVPQIISEFTE